MANTLGLDIGIGSVGSALIGDDKVSYMGVRIFDPANEASESRIHRSQRRNLARKKWRKEQLKEAFEDFGILTKEEIEQEGYLSFTTNNEFIKKPIEKTVYHLRLRALNEQVSKREILLSLYNILHARGHFLNETVDFEHNESITFNDYRYLFYDAVSNYVEVSNGLKANLDEILKYTFEEKVYQNEIKSKFKNLKSSIDERTEDVLLQTLFLIAGYSSNIKKISDEFKLEKDKTTVKSLKTLDEVDDFLASCVELYDLAEMHKVLKGKDYLCEVAVEKLDAFYKVVEEYGTDSEEFKNLSKELKENIAKDDPKHYRVVRNLSNSYPNGLYLKECVAILRNQSNYYPEINEDFIQVCRYIISARIPYYIGPLNENGKNAWVVKGNNFKYSYEYSQKKFEAVNEAESIAKWKKRMISHCTYLPECEALPKGSFISETFNILNELNILEAKDANGDDYYLTHADKLAIFDNLFLQKGKVSYKEVEKLLNLSYFGPRSGKGTFFNTGYTLYLTISNIIPELKLENIVDFSKDNKKIEKIEDIILSLNLYDEESTKIKHFEDIGYSEDVSKKLARLKSKSFCSYSKEFIMNTAIDTEGNSIMDKLFDDNTSSYTNEQMTIISKATDINGNPVDYISNKYEQRIKDNGNKLDYKILVDGDKPIISISRPVLRALNESMKVYLGIIDNFGVPDRVVVETARDLCDFSETKEKTVKFADNAEKQYNNLKEQLKTSYKQYKQYCSLEDYSEIKEYLEKNRTKISLYISQLGVDLLTGEQIDLSHLENYEVDHILPRGFGDDSMDDKMLIAKKVNAKKGNRLPLEFIGSCETVDGHKILIESDFINRASALFDMGAISEKKFKRLTLRTQDDLDEFLNQNLVDTRYIIREFMSILRAYNKVMNYDTHVVALKAAYTKTYRKAFGMDKVREYGDQHHAHDAALLCIADRTLSCYYPNYDRRKPNESKSDNRFATYDGFVQAVASKNNDDKKDELYRFIRYAYRKAFNEGPINCNSVIEQVKNYVPYYSLKVERNYRGQFFDLNPLPQRNYKESDVLTLLGVNDNKKVFSGVNCAAVDFYKYTDEKGNKVHFAVHIPKVIIDKDGNVDSEKYKTLIKEHYRKDELLDCNGNLKENYFRFRAFKNDLIYDTKHKTLFKFNIGSVVNKKLELKYVNIFSYNDIYELGLEISKKLKKEFNIKTRENKDGIEFSKVDKHDVVYSINSVYWKLECDDKKIANTFEKIKNDKNIVELSNHLAYLTLIINRFGTPPTIDGQYTPVIGSGIDKRGNDNDAQYVKLKYDILGVKTFVNADGGFVISTPIPGKYKKVTKEKFSWQISRNDL